MRKLACSLLVVLCITLITTLAHAGVIADVYAKKAEAAVYQTEVYGLPIHVEYRIVAVDRCVDGIRIWYTRSRTQTDDNQDSRIVRLRKAVKMHYPAADVSTSSANCPDNPGVNRVRFWHNGKAGDPAFYNAVERALNELGIGKVVVAEPRVR